MADLFGGPGSWRRGIQVVAAVAGFAVVTAGAPAAAVSASVSAEPAAADEVVPAGPLTAPDAVSAAAIARLEGEPVEVLGERTETGSVFALPNGSMAAGQGSGPVWVRRGGDGTSVQDWAEVDLSLVLGRDGLVRPVAHGGDLVLSGAHAGTGSSVVDASSQVDLAQVTDLGTGVRTRVQWAGTLPEPTLSGRRATYAEVQPGVDLVLEATSTGFEQFFVVRSRPDAGTAPSFPLTIVAEGAELRSGDDGALSVVSEGEVVASAPTPLMWDAASDKGRAFPVTMARPAENTDSPGLAPMPAWVRAKNQNAASKATEPALGEESPDASPVPVVGDGSIDPLADAVQVTREVAFPAPNVATVILTPQDDFLQDPATVFPVVVDPDVNLTQGFDTAVMSGFGDDRSGLTDLHVGTYDGGNHIGRAFIHFPTGAIAGKKVLSAELSLANYYSWSCSARNWQVWSTGPASTGTRWTSQPAWSGHHATNSETYGYSSGCAGGWTSTNVTSLAQSWASAGAGEGYVGIKAENEGDNYGWKKFFSANNGSYIPSIWVTYNSVPNTPTGLKVSNAPNGTMNGSWTNTKTPTLYATISDPDGGSIHGMFELADSTLKVIHSQNVLYLPNGSVASIVTPDLLDGGVYYFRVRVSDDMVEGPRSGWFNFGVDSTAPLAAEVNSDKYPNDSVWHPGPGEAGTFTFTGPQVDQTVTGYRWGLDKAPDPAQVVAGPAGAVGTLSITPATAGRHVLQAQTVDRAGNVSGVDLHTFQVGRAGIVAPEEGAQVVRRVRLAVAAQPGLTFVKYQWRRGPYSLVTTEIPPAQLSTSSGAVWTNTWQALPAGAGYTTWDAGAALGFQGGPVQVRAQVSASASGSAPYDTQWVTVTVNPDADGAASTQVGPGSVNLLTGDHTISVTDAEEFGLSLVRTTSSRDPDSGYELQGDKLSTAEQQASAATTFTGNSTVAVSTARFHTGTTSVSVNAPAGNTNGDTYAAVGGDNGTPLRLGLKGGRSYRLSGWVLIASTGASVPAPTSPRGLSMTFFTRTGSAGYTEVSSPRANVAITNAWQRVTFDATVPAGSTEAFLRLYNGYTAASGQAVYWDDLSVRELWSPFGPEWSTGTVDAAAGTAFTKITRPYVDTASVQLTGGGEIWFTSGDGKTWWPQPGAEDLKLTAPTPTTWRLTEIGGTITDFEQKSTAGDFPVKITSAPAAPGGARSVYEPDVTTGNSRLKKIIAPIEPGVDGGPGNPNACMSATPAKGCEVMELDYASATTATASTPGAYTGRVSTVAVWGWDPTTATMTKTPVAAYTYAVTGRLHGVQDPRIVAAGAPALVTTYEYDSAGRLTKVTTPGDTPFRFTYGAAGASKTGAGDWIDPSLGRLLKVTRASLVPGTTSTWGPDNISTVVYNVPLTRATGGPYDLNPTALNTWAQTDGPTDATAVFGPQDVPAVTTASATTPGTAGYKPATVHYLNVSGLEVNTASPASADTPVEGFIDTAEYDQYGNTIRTLDATNRLLALKKLPGWSPSLTQWGLSAKSTVELAQLFDTRTSYGPGGLDVLSELGPVQQVAVANNPADLRTLRPSTTNTYDGGAPDAVAYHLLTSSTSAGTDITTGAQVDPITTVNGYGPINALPALDPTSGWVHKHPTQVTVDAGQATALTSTVVYDSTGRPVKSSKPGSNGADASTTLSVLYTAAANTPDTKCGLHPEWAGQPCLTRAAGPIESESPAATRMSANLTVKSVTAYNKFGSPTIVTETVTGPIAGVTVTQTRTTTTTYDAADRVTSVQITGTGTGVGAAISKTTTVYDPATGEVRENRAVDGTGTTVSAVKKSFDQLGQLVTYTDGKGSSTTTTYDRYGQPATATETATDTYGTRTIGSVAYTYDRAKDPRGLLTSFTDSVAGTFTAEWGPDGQLQKQTLPGGVALTIAYDPARVPTSRTYTRTSDSVVIASDRVIENNRGQWIRHASDTSTRDYTYDRLGRLTKVNDTAAITNVCTTRTYAYDTHSNRTATGTKTAAAGAACTDPTSTESSTYDTADRLVTSPGNAGADWTYDPLGRITTMPTGDATTTINNGFYTNDLIATQTQPGVARQTWGLDALQRRSSATTDTWVNGAWASSASKLSHYGSDSDEPSWIQEDTTLPDDVTRYVAGVEGDLAITTTRTGGRVLQLVDLHGDITATLPLADGAPTATWTDLKFTAFDEFGKPQPLTGGAATTGPPTRYGWLGAAQRSADTLDGTLLMGVRLYSPTTGRFLSVDPVPGGSASAYDYCNADPINCTDLAGTWTWKGALKTLAVVGEFASMIPGPVGAIAGGVSAVAYLATGNKKAALAAAGGAVLALAGLGAVAAAVKVARGVQVGKIGLRAGKSRVFWSGGEAAMKAASSYARATGGRTLEMTVKGRALTGLTRMVGFSRTKSLWEAASSRFASSARGRVDVFLRGTAREKSIWNRIEKPALMRNGVRIVRHSVR